MKRTSKYDRHIKTDVASAVADALSEFETLAGELRDWYDAMPENLQGSSKGDEVSEAADALESIGDSIDVPKSVATLSIEYTEHQQRQSRSARRDYAVRMLQAAIDEAQAYLEEHEDADDVSAFIDEAQSALDEAEGVEFPGMY